MKNLNWMGYGVGLLIAGLFIVAWAFIEEAGNLQRELVALRDSVAVRVDTIYAPPEPGWIEAFRLQCEWVPRKDTTDERN